MMNLFVAPNPASGKTTVSFNAPADQAYTLKLIDMIGNSVLVTQVNAVEGLNTKDVSLEGIARGLYILSLEREGSKPELIRISVQ
jgi:hypothetical protein